MSSPPQLSSFVNLLIFSKTENSLFKNTLILNREYATEKPSTSPPPFQFLATNLTDIQSHVCLSIRFFRTGQGYRKNSVQSPRFTDEGPRKKRGEFAKECNVSGRALVLIPTLVFFKENIQSPV